MLLLHEVLCVCYLFRWTCSLTESVCCKQIKEGVHSTVFVVLYMCFIQCFCWNFVFICNLNCSINLWMAEHSFFCNCSSCSFHVKTRNAVRSHQTLCYLQCPILVCFSADHFLCIVKFTWNVFFSAAFRMSLNLNFNSWVKVTLLTTNFAPC